MKQIFAVLIFSLFLLKGSAQQDSSFIRRLDTPPLSVLQVDMRVKLGREHSKALAWLRFFDSADHTILEYKGESLSGTSFAKTGFYTETPPKAKYAVVSVERDSGITGDISVDSFKTVLEPGNSAKRYSPLCDLDQYMLPFWKSDTIYNETVLLLSKNGTAATGRLLFMPAQILSVKSFDLKTGYSKKTDYTLNGRTISRRKNSKMPFRTDTSFDTKNNLAWYYLQSQWIVVTYTHKDHWQGMVPVFKGNMMPRTLSKLKAKSPLNIVAYGMSITRGLDVSGYDKVAPYMPTYVELFARALKKIYGDDKISMYNAGLPGAVVSWGAEYADQYINPLKPDLLVIDFGMNDFWRFTPEEFKAYIETIIKKVRTVNPETEFLLLSNLKFDPDYVLDSDKNKVFYQGNMLGYANVLKQMETAGIINLDMTTLSGIIYSRKKAKDCLANPLHPNDYMARWYAQGLAALFQQ
jgi:hypothetical protein